ncbi:MAG: peptide chain release factor N(5)-glutamine methyltransferase [Aeriscardovia sp.]|nr:peptide chain release factor N(5)-glutamine methyltransferase [Aeriscardovia sp.]
MSAGACRAGQAESVHQAVTLAAATLGAAGIDHTRNEAVALVAEAFRRCGKDTESSDVVRWDILGTSVIGALGNATPGAAAADGGPADGENHGTAVAGTDSVTPGGDPKARRQAFGRWLDNAVARRSQREPLQHIVGHVDFYGAEYLVGSGVFVPRPETEWVVAAAVDWLRAHRGGGRAMVVDLCAGSGVMGLSVARHLPGADVWQVEKDEQAYAWLRRNVVRLSGDGRAARDVRASDESDAPVSLPNGSRVRTLLADAAAPGTLAGLDGRVDAVVCNPPYLPESRPVEQPEALQDPAIALYGGSADGTAIPRLLVARASRLLRPGGALLMEHDVTQAAAMRIAFEDAGLRDVSVKEDGTHRPRWTQGVRGNDNGTGRRNDAAIDGDREWRSLEER